MKKVRLEVSKITYDKQKEETTTKTAVIKDPEAIKKLSMMCFLERYLNDTDLMRIISLIDEKLEFLNTCELPKDLVIKRIDIYRELRGKVEGLL